MASLQWLQEGEFLLYFDPCTDLLELQQVALVQAFDPSSARGFSQKS
jgi:hypothetical protein